MKTFTKIIFLLFFFIMTSGLYLNFLQEEYFNIKNIEVTKGLVLLDGEIHDALITLKGKNIWNIDVETIEEELRKDVRIKDISIKKEMPSKLIVSIEEEKPYIKVKNNNKILIANEKGKIFSFAKELAFEDLILLNLGNKNEMDDYLKVVKNIEDKELISFISEVYKSDKEIKILLNDGVHIKTDSTVDKTRYEIAKRLYKKLKNEGKEFNYIDIRFEDYIVK